VQARGSIHAVDALVIHRHAFAIQQTHILRERFTGGRSAGLRRFAETLLKVPLGVKRKHCQILLTVNGKSMDDPIVAFTIEDLARLLGLKPRTIHFWKQTGLFEGPGAGPGARYDEEHLGTLFLIDKLRSGGTSLAEIKKEISRQSSAGLRRLAEQAKATPKPPPPTAKQLIAGWLSQSSRDTRSTGGANPPSASASRIPRSAASSPPQSARGSSPSAWERVPLADGVELHVRQPSTSASRKLVRELIAFAQRARKE